VIEKAVRRAEHTRADVLAFPLSGDSVSNSRAAAMPSLESQELFAAPLSLGRRIFLLMTAIICITAVIWMVAPSMATWMANLSSTTSGVASASPAEASVPHETYVGADIKDLRKIAAQGDADAEYALGRRYATGDGTTQDYREAMRWFLAAAEQGNVKAQGRVAAWMWAGRGAPQDYSKAYYWALLAQAGGDDAGRAIVLNSAPYLSPAQVAAEQKQAENWLHTHHIGQASQ